MNDRIVNILEQYDVTLLKAWKGRSALLCDTEQGLKIIREYTGPLEKLCVLEAVGEHLRQEGFLSDCILRTKEGALFVRGRDGNVYIVKDHYEGRECSVSDSSDCVRAVRQLAQLHLHLSVPPVDTVQPLIKKTSGQEAAVSADGNAAAAPGGDRAASFDRNAAQEEAPDGYRFRMFDPVREYERYNRELKRIWKHLRNKSDKTDFEVFLLHHYPFFMEQAKEALALFQSADVGELYRRAEKEGALCHGDFQYHNILFTDKGAFVMNFEKCMMDVRIRDFYLFFRKVMEKNNWNIYTGRQLLEAYDAVRPIDAAEKKLLCLKLCYPERFRKVVSYYYNSGKAWIPAKNREKIDRLLAQEDARKSFLKNLSEA
ncbi:MAG: CotS family spore coat protein [bacterium]|nr:CotS family spore coat protein [bacterium]